MLPDLTPEQKSALIDAVYGDDDEDACDPSDACDAVISVVAQMLADERERIAQEIEQAPAPKGGLRAVAARIARGQA